MVEYSLAALIRIKNDILKIFKVFSRIVFFIFVLYNVYLIASNYNKIPYLVIYSLMLVLTIVFEIIKSSKIDEALNRRDRKNIEKKKKIVKRIIKNAKYVLKGGIIALAIIEIMNGRGGFLVISTILSGVLLLIQILFDIIMTLIFRYIDYLKVAIGRDIDSLPGFISNKIRGENYELNRQLDEAEGISPYDKKEQEILDILEADVKINREKAIKKAAKDKIEKASIIKRLKEIALDKKQKDKVDKDYDNCIKKAGHINQNSKELNKVLAKSNELIKLIGDHDVKDILVRFHQIIEGTVADYTIPESNMNDILGVLIYLNSLYLVKPIIVNGAKLENLKLVINEAEEANLDFLNNFKIKK